MTLLEHLGEFRRRLLWALGAVFIAFLACWGFARPIFEFLAQPIYRWLPPGQKLVFTGVTDAFMLYVKVAGLAALFVASPFVLYQAWRFVAPALYSREKRYAVPFIVFGTLFFLAGGAFAYYVAFPFAVQFLLEAGADFTPMITVERYLGFLMTVILGLGLMFELPILIVLLAQIGVVTPSFLIRKFRWAAMIIAATAALITPTPDVFNMALFAVPALLLYLLGTGAAVLVVRAKARRQREMEMGEARG
jgi:sec-independent protein translocase protein TatC